jgi:hypothetical protein
MTTNSNSLKKNAASILFAKQTVSMAQAPIPDNYGGQFTITNVRGQQPEYADGLGNARIELTLSETTGRYYEFQTYLYYNDTQFAVPSEQLQYFMGMVTNYVQARGIEEWSFIDLQGMTFVAEHHLTKARKHFMDITEIVSIPKLYGTSESVVSDNDMDDLFGEEDN